MSDDLIDRNKLLENIENWAFQECPIGVHEPESDVYKTIKEAIRAIKEQPTAYDVGKVVDKLETYISQQSENEMLSNNGK